MIIIQNSNKYIEQKYKSEEIFENEVYQNHKYFFGKDSIFIITKKKIGAGPLGNAIPDGFLFDMSKPDNREFYLVEIELESHDFYKHIFPQITKFFGFFRSNRRQKELVDSLYSIIHGDISLEQQFKKYLGVREIFKFLTDIIDNSQNILLLMDGEKPELPEIQDTYIDTWGKMVKIITIKKFICDNQYLYTVYPEFDTIEFPVPEEEELKNYSEEMHFEGVNDVVKDIYKVLKETVNRINNSYIFNPQKYYISIKGKKNVAYLEIRNKKIRLIILLSDDYVRTQIKHHIIGSLSEPVQKFYNSPCTSVYINDLEEFEEIVELLKHLLI
jgi:hypothetical protein